MKKFKNRRGVTLIELLVVIGILSLVMGAIYSLFTTHQRSAYTQDEVAEVQQNQRIAMDSITRDVRMAGMLVPTIPVKLPPIQLAGNATGVSQPLPAPDNVPSDEMTLNTASASSTFAKIVPVGSTDYTVTGTPFSVPVDFPESVDSFNVNDMVRIVRPVSKTEPTTPTEPVSVSRVYKITGKDRTAPSLELTIMAGYTSPLGLPLKAGDMICVTASPYTNPNTIRYCLGPTAACGSGGTCPAGQLCLMRSVNGASDVIAQNMAGLQFRYLLDDGTEVDAPANYLNVRAVRVMLTGQTVVTKALSGGQAKIRQIESVIQIRNR